MFKNMLAPTFLCIALIFQLCTTCTSENPDIIFEFGPVGLAEYEHAGSQEIIYTTIPAAYLSNFTVEWTGSVKSTGGIITACSNRVAIVMVQKWSLPIPFFDEHAVPDNTWKQENEATMANFTIFHKIENDPFPMDFSESTANMTDLDYYMSAFLAERSSDPYTVDGLSEDCEYTMKVTIKAHSSIPYNTAVIDSKNNIDNLNSSAIEVDYPLQKNRKGLLETDYVTAKEGYQIAQNSHLRFSWIVEPYSDVGGNLQVTIGITRPNATDVVLRACVMSTSDFSGTYDDCPHGYNMILNASSADESPVIEDSWYWPYPSSGMWIADIGVDCDSGYCDFNNTIFLDVNIIQCIESCHGNNNQGTCRIYRTDVLFFSACDCKGGWAGIACTDGTNAIPYGRQLLIVLLLTLSNVIFLPCGVLACIKKFYTEAIVYFFVMFFSTFYHACDEEYSLYLCIMKYDTLQFSDFLGSVSAMWFTIIAVANLPCRLESCLHVAGLMAISLAVSYNRFSVFTTLIPILCALVILAIRWGIKCKQDSSCYPDKRTWFLSIIPGVLCALVGFIIFAFVENSYNYFYTHSIWHLLMGSAVLFLIPNEKKSFLPRNFYRINNDINQHAYRVNNTTEETDLSDSSS